MTHCKSAFLALLLVGVTPLTVHADNGYLGVYTDATGSSCNFFDPGFAPVTGYVIHKFSPGGGTAYASRFSLKHPANWQPLSFTTPFAHVGVMQSDLAVNYGQCITTNTVIGTAMWFSVSPSAACAQLNVQAPDGFPNVVIADCAFNEVLGAGLTAYINFTTACCCDCIGTEQSTWGSVKALYR